MNKHVSTNRGKAFEATDHSGDEVITRSILREELISVVSILTDRFDERFTHLEDRMSQMENRMSQIERNMGAFAEHITHIFQQSMEGIMMHVERIDRYISKNEDDKSGLDRRVSRLENKVLLS